ncbi:MAG: hypothetical protein SCH71_05815 [Desulfobulbaceae bacterium]|nr:hypothetical protein [Desulfobulbaceae bacterium]
MKILQAFLLLFTLVLLVAGCARTDNFGKLVRSEEAGNSIETATILPDHTYYYSGPEARPDAIMALHNSFTLVNEKNLWIKVDITEEKLRSWNRIIRNEFRIKNYYYGSLIITPDGRQAGIWYSRDDHTVIKTPDPGNIIIYTPDSRINKRFRMRSFGGGSIL